ncbi:MAG: lipopolysaccharide assembly protein LapA domain-containing protein [Nitrospiria bacterium]
MIRTIFFMLIMFALFFILVNNKDQVVQIQYTLGKTSQPVPLYLLFIGTFLSGLGTAVILIFPGWLKSKLECRRQKKEIESLEGEVGQLRNQVSASSHPPGGNSPGSF